MRNVIGISLGSTAPMKRILIVLFSISVLGVSAQFNNNGLQCGRRVVNFIDPEDDGSGFSDPDEEPPTTVPFDPSIPILALIGVGLGIWIHHKDKKRNSVATKKPM
jgi:hypothetical protein